METLPENPGLALEEALSEPAGQPGAPDAPGARTDGLAAALAAEHLDPAGAGGGQDGPGGLKRRPGRPPIHGRYSQAAGSDGKNPVPLPGEGALEPAQVEPAGPARVSIPPDLLSKIVKEALGTAEAFAGSKLEAVALQAGLKREEIAPQLHRTQIPEERKDLVAELTPLALEELGADAKVSPSVAIGLMLGPWVLASVSAYTTLSRLAAEKLALDKQRGPQPSKP